MNEGGAWGVGVAAGFVAAGVVVVQTTRIGADVGPANETAVALEENGDDNNEGTDLIPTQSPEPPASRQLVLHRFRCLRRETMARSRIVPVVLDPSRCIHDPHRVLFPEL